MHLGHVAIPCSLWRKRKAKQTNGTSLVKFWFSVIYLPQTGRVGSPSLIFFVATLKKTQPPGKNSVPFVKATVDGCRGFKLMEMNLATAGFQG